MVESNFRYERAFIYVQDVFLVIVLTCVVFGFATGKLFPRKSIEEIVQDAVLKAYADLR